MSTAEVVGALLVFRLYYYIVPLFIAGALFAHTTGYISPESFRFGESILVLSMAVIGGLGSLYGSVIGAVVLSLGGPATIPDDDA
jgi:branched-subunit amino acid ABC-type transport system permease component